MSDFRFLTSNNENKSIPKKVRQPLSKEKSVGDEERFRRSGQVRGLPIGQFIHNAPMIFSKDGHNMWFGDMYRGKSAFLILSGPSFSEFLSGANERYGSHYNMLSHPGFITMGVNNSVKTFRPNLWITVDQPDKFIRSAWLDPQMMKFTAYENVAQRIMDTDSMQHLSITVGNCPNTWFYRRNELFNPNTFMFEDTFNWGNSKEHGGKRSVMLVALRMLYYLGIRNVYLLGCDFHMSADYTYHFEQSRHKSSVKSNNSTYEVLQERFSQLNPIFEKLNFHVFNCNINSNLTSFPFIDFEKAWEQSLEGFPVDLYNENTEGLYDREYKKRMIEKGKKIEDLY